MEVHHLGLAPYAPTAKAMRDFTLARTPDTEDQLWVLQHYPVFTQGQTGRAEHLLDTGDIQVVQSDRGGQITYHGPGQIVVYCLLDIRRADLHIRQLVGLLEEAVINTLTALGVDHAIANPNAPGVYVDSAKIAALGLRVCRGCSYHGLSLNVDMDLSPFERINPCGFEQKVTQVADHCPVADFEQVSDQLLNQLCVLWPQSGQEGRLGSRKLRQPG